MADDTRGSVGSALPNACPRLGLLDDPASCAAYPRADHRCAVPGVGPPGPTWQRDYCLGAHAACPHFATPLTAEVAAPATRRVSRRAVLAGAGAGCVIALTLGAAAWQRDASGTPAASASPTSVALAPTATHEPVASVAPTRSAPTATTVPTVMPTPRATATATAPATRAPAPTATPQPPTPTLAPTPTTTPTQPPTPVAAQTHIVIAGEYLEEIAARYGVTVAELQALNHLTDADVIIPGEELLLPPDAVDSQAGSP